MRLNIREHRQRWYWRLYDGQDRLVAKSAEGYTSYALCRDSARFVWEGLRACLKQ